LHSRRWPSATACCSPWRRGFPQWIACRCASRSRFRPLALAPTFLAAFATSRSYPLRFSGEIAECILGFGFAFAALVWAREASVEVPRPTPGLRLARDVAATWLLALGLALACAHAARLQGSVSPELLADARTEIAALRRDFLAQTRAGRPSTRCPLEQRLYAYRTLYRREFLARGAFASLRARGLPAERAEFFLDPWNSPYWILDRCNEDASRRLVTILSFGPNRRRDSVGLEIRSDDLAGVVLRVGDPAE